MSSVPSKSTVPRYHHIAVVVAFAIGVLAPVAGMIAGLSGDVARLEFREPAALPSLSFARDQLSQFPKSMDEYLNDHFGFRARLLALNSRVHLALGVSPAEKFMLGQSGWYFLRGDEHGELALYRGTDRFSYDELEQWIATMEGRQAALAQQGIRFLITVAPSKHEIYPEYLPRWANVVDPVSRYKQVVARIAEGSPLELVDLHEPLRRAKRDHRVYHKTDGHWNELGAYYAYVAIVERLQRDFPALVARPLSWFDLTWHPEPFGVITRRMNVADQVLEDVPELRPRGRSHVIKRSWPDEIPEGESEELYFTQRFVSDLKRRPSVVFLRDSFSTDLAVFAKETFHSTVLLHHWFGHFREDEVLRYKPDVVVYELLERGLAWELK